MKDKIIEFIFKLLNCSNSNYYTYWIRPKNTDDIRYGEESFSDERIGIVLQGQVIVKDHFTLKTIELYHRLYYKSPIILSTWANENKEEINKIRTIGNVYVIENEYPSISGHGHINYQRKSSINGIKKAKELRCEYVLKSRTDQRMCGKNAIKYLVNLIENYPLTIECKAKKRIAVCSLSTLKNRLYNICDMLLFGDIDDVLLYFNPPEAPSFNDKLPDEENYIDYAKARPGEIYFATHYIENCGFDLKWTFEDSDYYRNNLFIVFNSEAVDQFWPKYNFKEYKWKSYTNYPHEIVSFEEWFMNQKLVNSSEEV